MQVDVGLGFKFEYWRSKSFFEEGWLSIDFSCNNVIIIL